MSLDYVVSKVWSIGLLGTEFETISKKVTPSLYLLDSKHFYNMDTVCSQMIFQLGRITLCRLEFQSRSSPAKTNVRDNILHTLKFIVLLKRDTWNKVNLLETAYGRATAYLHTFLTMALTWGERSASSDGHFNPRDTASDIHWSWVRTRVPQPVPTPWKREKSLAPVENRAKIPQSLSP
jgi:hypothetical protein